MGKKKANLIEKMKKTYVGDHFLEEKNISNIKLAQLMLSNINKKLSFDKKYDLFKSFNGGNIKFGNIFNNALVKTDMSLDEKSEVFKIINSQEYSKETYLKAYEKIQGSENGKKFNEEFSNLYIEGVKELFNLNTALNNEITFNFINKCDEALGDDADLVIPDEKYYDKPENTIGLYVSLYKENVVKELKEKNKDENILLEEAEKIAADYNSGEEVIYFYNQAKKTTEERTKQQVVDMNKYIGNDDSLFLLKDGDIVLNTVNNKARQKTVKDIFNNKIVLPETDIEDIKKVFDKIKDTNDNIAIEKLSNSKKKVKEGIDKKDLSKIKEGVKEYTEAEKKYKGILKDISKLGKQSDIPASLSFGVNNGASVDISKDIRGGAIYKALFDLNVALKDSKVTIDDILNNPLEASKTFLREKQENNPMTKMLKEKPLYYSIDALFKNNYDMINAQTEYYGSVYSFYLGLDAINCITSGKNPEFGAFTKSSISSVIFDTMPESKDLFTKRSMGAQEIIKSLVILDDEDRDLMKVQVEPKLDMNTINYIEPGFDSKKYIVEKDNCNSIIGRLVDLQEKVDSYTSKFEEGNEYTPRLKYDQNIFLSRALKDVSKELLSYAKLDRDQKNICKAIRDGKYKKLSKEEKENFISSCKASIAKENGTLNKEFGEHMKKLIELEEKYNKTNGFFKVFGPETRRLKRSINSIKANLKSIVPNEELYNSIYDDIKNNRLDPNGFFIGKKGEKIVDNISSKNGAVKFKGEFDDVVNNTENSKNILESSKQLQEEIVIEKNN